MASVKRPVLWHIAVSHYSEKARWALDYKGVEHDRRKADGGMHIPVALWLTRGKHKTFPVLELEGRRIGDSTAIVEALERRYPDPPLYPADEAQRQRALALEDWFDENVGPHVRRLAWHEVARDTETLTEMATKLTPPPLSRSPKIAAAGMRQFMQLRYGVRDPKGAEKSRLRIVEGFDRLEAELDGRDYLAGDRFSVADLTAASLFYPLVAPDEGPDILPTPPEPLERFIAPIRERPGYRWVEEMFRRHRKTARESDDLAVLERS